MCVLCVYLVCVASTCPYRRRDVDGSSRPNRERVTYSKASKRERGRTQNPARERERTYSKSSKRERGRIQNPATEREREDLFKIQQERDELFKILQERDLLH